jgi:hypothetical protein
MKTQLILPACTERDTNLSYNLFAKFGWPHPARAKEEEYRAGLTGHCHHHHERPIFSPVLVGFNGAWTTMARRNWRNPYQTMPPTSWEGLKRWRPKTGLAIAPTGRSGLPPHSSWRSHQCRRRRRAINWRNPRSPRRRGSSYPNNLVTLVP